MGKSYVMSLFVYKLPGFHVLQVHRKSLPCFKRKIQKNAEENEVSASLITASLP